MRHYTEAPVGGIVKQPGHFLTMTVCDLSNAQRASLMRKLRRREAIEQRGGNPPKGLRLSSLKAEYGLTDVDMQAILKGMK
ncbi:MAG: hypothetical protein ABGX16_07745 [Pirellulales bacterium]